MPQGQLEKMTILAYNNQDFADSHQVGSFVAMMNPELYTLDYKVEFADRQGQGTSGSHQSFTLKPPEEMSFEFLFDNTGIIDGRPRADLDDEVYKFKELLVGLDSSSHEPKHFKLGWGTFLFKGRCSALNIAYRLFSSDGKPIRAVCKATFKGSIDESLRIAQDNLHSPDLTHYRTIRKGDSLPYLCYQIYGDSRHYLSIAKANGLTDFRRLEPGHQLFFPPFEKNTAS
jgi:phage tail protein X